MRCHWGPGGGSGGGDSRPLCFSSKNLFFMSRGQSPDRSAFGFTSKFGVHFVHSHHYAQSSVQSSAEAEAGVAASLPCPRAALFIQTHSPHTAGGPE